MGNVVEPHAQSRDVNLAIPVENLLKELNCVRGTEVGRNDVRIGVDVLTRDSEPIKQAEKKATSEAPSAEGESDKKPAKKAKKAKAK